MTFANADQNIAPETESVPGQHSLHGFVFAMGIHPENAAAMMQAKFFRESDHSVGQATATEFCRHRTAVQHTIRGVAAPFSVCDGIIAVVGMGGKREEAWKINGGWAARRKNWQQSILRNKVP